MGIITVIVLGGVAIVAVWRVGVWRDRFEQAEGVAAAVQAALEESNRDAQWLRWAERLAAALL
ncbi:MAG: hypothetical protein BWX86_00598 [Verrucomicrobia bacterium ADurb.Bin122]|nr:MAG: hypothetical protein BWX86_00598 [Verrucomicrobia bacterium ADurb.Bin122]